MLDILLALVVLGIMGMFWFFAGLTRDRRREEQREHEEFIGVIKTNAKADNSINDSDLDKRVREKYNKRR